MKVTHEPCTSCIHEHVCRLCNAYKSITERLEREYGDDTWAGNEAEIKITCPMFRAYAQRGFSPLNGDNKDML